MRFILSFLFAFQTGLLIAQPKYDIEQLRKKFPEAIAVVVNEEVLNLDVVSDKLYATRNHLSQYIILDEKALGLSERTVTYIPGFFELLHFEASTYIPNGKSSYKKLRVTQWEDKNRISDMFFFDDVKYRNFIFPGVEKGAVLELKYTYNHLDPNMQFPFYFQENVPMIKGSFTLNYTDKVKPYVRFFGDTLETAFTEIKKGKWTTQTWTVTDVPELKGHSNAPAHPYYLTHLFPLIKEYKTTKGWQKGLTTPKELYAHNYSFLKDLNTSEPDKNLKELVDSLKKQSLSEEELVRNIYYWVQDNLRYIAFEDGLGGFVPRQANDVFRKRYGDCKDMASILTYMYKQAGFPAYICWIGTRDLPYSYNDLPAPNADNHMIAAVFLNNQWHFLDATARYLPFGFPSGFIQGKEAMVSISPDSFQVVKVPVMPAMANTNYDSTYLSLQDDLLKGNISLKLEGYNKFYLMERLMLVKSHEKDEMVERLLARGNNKCRIKNIQYINEKHREKPMWINANMELQNYARLIDGNWYLNLNLEKDYNAFKIDTSKRSCGREFEHTFHNVNVYSLEIPKGYKPAKLPKDLEFKGKKFGYLVKYSTEKSKLKYRVELYVNTLLLSKHDFVEWNKHIDKILQAYKETIILEKVGG